MQRRIGRMSLAAFLFLLVAGTLGCNGAAEVVYEEDADQWGVDGLEGYEGDINELGKADSSRWKVMTREEFAAYLNKISVSRSIYRIQNHHTWLPDYNTMKKNTPARMMQGMYEYHTGSNGWDDIAQTLSTFPDGTIILGRDFNKTPIGIKGFNTGAVCIEHVGNFDKGKDEITAEQKKTIAFVNAALVKRFSIPLSTDNIVYHHWFDLNTGKRTDGTGSTKSCPGDNFFGGNTVDAAKANFVPAVKAELDNLGGSVSSSNPTSSSSSSTCWVGGQAGTCKAVSSCSGKATAGLCPGAANIQCCVEAPKPTVYGSCTANGRPGQCIATSACTTGAPVAGLCPGAANIQCCPLAMP